MLIPRRHGKLAKPVSNGVCASRHGGCMKWNSTALALAALLVAAPVHAAKVDLALVMAADVSASVDAGEYRLQHEGIARAFESPAVLLAIAGGKNGAIDATVIEWSDRDKQVVTVPWMRVSDAASARSFAARVRGSKRSSNGLTAIGDALLAAAAAFKALPDHPARRMIDLSGDGMANIGPPPDSVRDALVAQGIVINGLAILKTEPWLGGYYNDNVVGGAGAFLLDVKDFGSFAQAMQQKLLNEITADRSRHENTSAGRKTRLKSRPPTEWVQMQ
jgi:Protein of unknown function (DUF1194)